MGLGRVLTYARLAFLAKDPADRQLYRLVKRRGVRRVVELGIDVPKRTAQMLSLAADHAADGEVQYAGFDRFEERPAGVEPLALIEAHRALAGVAARVRLTPGEPAAAAAGAANSLADTDLVLISPRLTDADLARLWPYAPRMCHPGTVVLRGVGETGESWDQLPLDAVAALSEAAAVPRAA